MTSPATAPRTSRDGWSLAGAAAGVDLRRLFLLCAGIYLAVKLAFLALFAWNTQFVMDEYVQGGYSLHAAEFYRTLDPLKTVLYAYFYLPARLLSGSAVGLLHLARLQTLALAVATVATTWKIARSLGAERGEALFAVSVLLSFSTFLERDFRVRAEPLAALLALLALAFALGGRPRFANSLRRALAVGALAGASFLTTQKAIYYAFAFAAAYLLVPPISAGHSRPERVGSRLAAPIAFGAGWVAANLVYAVGFGGRSFLHVLRVVFLGPADLALHGADYYGNLRIFLSQTLQRNTLAYGLAFAGLAVAAVRWGRLDRSARFALVSSLVVAALIFAHNQPWPYVFVMALPFLAPWSVETLRLLAGSDRRRRGGVALVLLAMLALSLVRNLAYLGRDNGEQDRVVSQAESLLAPADRYADGIGMVPTRHRAGDRWWWDAITVSRIREAAQTGDLTPLASTFADQPKVWIWNYRVDALQGLLAPYFKDAYVRVYPNVLLTGVELEPGVERPFQNHWGGRYRLYGPGGAPDGRGFRLDGQEVHGAVELRPGRHRVELPAGGGRALLLPADVPLPSPLPAVGPPRRLFDGVYD